MLATTRDPLPWPQSWMHCTLAGWGVSCRVWCVGLWFPDCVGCAYEQGCEAVTEVWKSGYGAGVELGFLDGPGVLLS